MALTPLGSGILGGFLSSIFDTAGSAAGSAFTYQQQKDLAKYQYDLNMQGWREMNEYNTPKNQMARYQEAGLNPNLIYGTGSASAGNAGSFPEYKAPNLSRFQAFDNIGSQVLAGMMQIKQLSNLDKQGQLLEAQTDLAHHNSDVAKANAMNTLAMVPGTRAKSIMADIETHYYEDKQKYALRQAAATLQETERRVELIGKQVTNAELDAALKKLDAQLKRIDIQMAPYRLQQIKALTRKTLLEGDIINWQLGLRDLGIPPNAPWLVPFLVNILGSENVANMVKSFQDWLKGFLSQAKEKPLTIPYNKTPHGARVFNPFGRNFTWDSINQQPIYE